jgi:signal transduction histidine kinase
MAVKLGTLADLVDNAEASALTRELIDAFGDLGNDIQSLSHRLHSSKLDILGLVPSIESLCADIAKEYGIPVDFEHANVPPEIPADAALCVFRIVQEGLRNAVRHSGASRIDVRLAADAGELSLTVVDNGTGIALTPQSPPHGIGIQSMRERTRMLGGSFDIHAMSSTPGTRIAVTVPLSTGG